MIAELTDIKKNELIFQRDNGEQISVTAPEIITPLLKENERYSIVLYSNRVRAPFLKKISSVSD